MMGYDLMINFRQPYFARSIGEFWHRWHISLSTWFRDYLYIPLGGNRVSTPRFYFNVVAVFLLSGLWHGANWTFALWGLLHGGYFVLGHMTASARQWLTAKLSLERAPRLLGVLRLAATFALVTVAWVFFRAATVRDALYIVSHLADPRGFQPQDIFQVGLPRFEMMIALLMLLFVPLAEAFLISSSPRVEGWRASTPLRWVSGYACALAIVCLGVFGKLEFIYFQF